MTRITTADTTESVLNHLQEQGYEPQEEHDWFDLIVSGTSSVRVSLDDYDGDYVNVFAFDAHMACEWEAGFSHGTPAVVVIAVIEAAESQLAAKRGGPVTPAQAERLR